MQRMAYSWLVLKKRIQFEEKLQVEGEIIQHLHWSAKTMKPLAGKGNNICYFIRIEVVK